MTSEHDLVQEALAARALRADTGEDGDRTDAFVAVHLATCDRCRRAKSDFESLAGELALATPSREPPKMLHHRIRRDIGRRRTARYPLAGTAAAVIVAIGLAAWSLHLTGRVSRAEQQQASTAEVISLVSYPESRVVPLTTAVPSAETQVAAVYVPGHNRLDVVGAMPMPGADHVYQLWLGRSGSFADGGTFVPGPGGFVLVRISTEASDYDHLLITEETGHGGDQPSAQRVAESDL